MTWCVPLLCALAVAPPAAASPQQTRARPEASPAKARPLERAGPHGDPLLWGVPISATPGWGGPEGELVAVVRGDGPATRDLLDEARAVAATVFAASQRDRRATAGVQLVATGDVDVALGALWLKGHGALLSRGAPAHPIHDPGPLGIDYDQPRDLVPVAAVFVWVADLERGPIWVISAAATPERATEQAARRIAELRAFEQPLTLPEP